MSSIIALDIGGTFTDLVSLDPVNGSVHHAKSSTTPYDLAVGIRETLLKSELPLDETESFVHGSTVAINTAIERTGARTALFVTRGMRDIYQIGRGNRPEAYNLFFKRPEPYIPRHLTFEVDERLDAAGDVVIPFDEAQAREAVARLPSDVESVAVCFIHSWANPEHERELGKILQQSAPAVYTSLSSDILREYREYERLSTTALNAYVGPRVSQYLGRLEQLLAEFGFQGQLLIMQSNGGIMAPETAKRVPVATMESGPVGGIIAAAEISRNLGIKDVIAFDMGGTTAKVSLVQDNQPAIAQGYYVGTPASGHPVMLPVVDIIEVGAGGGSIAWIDSVGALKVGPRSAGGHPGPVCYGQGGTEPTVTDANVVLGRLNSSLFLGGEMPLNVEGAREAIRTAIAEPLGLTVNQAAVGIVSIAIAEMGLAVRGVSVERGYDPRDFALVGFGGAGPLHAAEIARELHIPRLIVPRFPGHFSALGMLLADLRHDYVRTYYRPLLESDFGVIESIFTSMIAEAQALMLKEGAQAEGLAFRRYLDVRYIGQEFPIQTPVSEAHVQQGDHAAVRAAFNDIHERRYGHQAIDEPVEVVNLRLTATGRRQRLVFPSPPPAAEASPIAWRDVVLLEAERPQRCPVYDRDQLGVGCRIGGPAIISEYASTTVLFPGDTLRVAESGEMIIEIGGSD